MQATIATDNMLRIYECVEQPSLVSWVLTEELDVLNIVAGPSPAQLTRAQSVALATPTQTNSSSTDGGASAQLVAQALQQGLQQQGTAATQNRGGNREADGGWCISWCKDKYWGEIIAAGCNTSGVIKVSLSGFLFHSYISQQTDHPNKLSPVLHPPHPLAQYWHGNLRHFHNRQ